MDEGGGMKIEVLKGNRSVGNLNDKSITIFLMSFIYPSNTGYSRRMELIINWMNLRFKHVNFIIPCRGASNNNPLVVNFHLDKCNQLFLIHYENSNAKLFSIKKLAYKIITGRYPKMDSSLVLDKALVKGFKQIFNNLETDYFFNTRIHYTGLVSFIPAKVISLFDTGDIFTEMYKNFSILNVNKFLKPLLCGYRESEVLFKSEKLSLEKYDKIIAISQSDFETYQDIDSLKLKTVKIDSVGFQPAATSVAKVPDKKYDLLLIASHFIATERGVNWLLNEVAPKLKKPLTLCVVGTIGEYIKSTKFEKSKLKIINEGIVKDIKKYYNESKLVVLCMLEGTGTSVKGLEALSFGAAIVTTQLGVRSLQVISEEHVYVADNSDQFATYIEELLVDKVKRENVGKKALKFYSENFSLDSAINALNQLILDE